MVARKIYWKRGRAYGDFREYAAFGGRQEALVPPEEAQATTDRRLAEQLYGRSRPTLDAQ